MSSAELGKGRRDVAEHVIGLWFGKTEISEVVEGHGKLIIRNQSRMGELTT